MDLAKTAPNVCVTVTLADLREYSLALIEEAKEQAAQLETERANNEMIVPREVKKRYGISISTLWRWDKTDYLKPIKIGRKSLYRVADIERLMQGKEA